MYDPETRSAKPRASRISPPVVKVAVDKACVEAWKGRVLSPYLRSLDVLLLLSSEASIALDALPLRETVSRSKTLVDVVSAAYKAKPSVFSALLQTVAPGLKNDRSERTGGVPDKGIDSEVVNFTRIVTVEPKAAWRPRE